MSRRQSLDRPGILSPPGPFLTPSPSPSISASPRLQPSPSLSPFPQDVLLVTGNPLANANTHDQERKAVTPGRRQSIHQFTNGSPNAGTVVFQPSPSQSPAAATSVIGITTAAGGALNVVANFQNAVSHVAATTTTPTTTTLPPTTTGNELNTTLVGSNNIQLNKKGNKRQQQLQHQQQQQLQQQQHHQIFSSSTSHYSNNNTTATSHPSPSSASAVTTSSTLASGYGQSHATTINNTPNTFAPTNVACTPKNQTKKGANSNNAHTASNVLSLSQQSQHFQQHQQQQQHHQQFQQYHSGSPLIADSPSPSPSGTTITAASIKPPTPQPPAMQMLQQQFTIASNGSGGPGTGPQQTFQLIQGPQGQIIAAATTPSPQQQHHQHQQQRFTTTPNANIATTTSGGTGLQKANKSPQQILPKPQQQLMTDTQRAKNSAANPTQQTPVTSAAASGNMSQASLTQISQSATQPGQPQQIILPSGATASLTTTSQQPLLLNQVPVLVQQNTPQGVQLILRPPTPQLTGAPSLVIQNARPQQQLQQQQPQQVLRILGANGATMQFATTPTFVVSSQANLIQQANHLQAIKTQSQNPAITQLSGLHAALSAAAAANQQPRSQQFTTTAATINGHLLGPSVAAQLQNLQMAAAAAAANGNGLTAQIQMQNGLSAASGAHTLLSQLPTSATAQFQANSTQGLINLNQLSNANIQQFAAAAAAAGATFQTPATPSSNATSNVGQQSQQNAGNNVASANGANDLFSTNLTQSSPAHVPVSVTPEPMRQSTPILHNLPAASPQQTLGNNTQIQLQLNAAATIQMQQQQQHQQQQQIHQLQQQIQQTQNQVQQAQQHAHALHQQQQQHQHHQQQQQNLQQQQLQQLHNNQQIQQHQQQQLNQQQQQPPPPTETKKKAKPRRRKPAASAAASATNIAAAAGSASAAATSTNINNKPLTTTANKTLNTATSTTTAVMAPAITSNSNSNATTKIVPIQSQQTSNLTTVPQQQQQQAQQQQQHFNQHLNESQQQRPKSPSPPPHQIQRASNGKLDLGNVMKLCGITEDDDEDFMDTSMGNTAMEEPPQQQQQQHHTIHHNAQDYTISIPQPNASADSIPYTLSIPGVSGNASLGHSDAMDHMQESPAANIVIKIDPTESLGQSSTSSSSLNQPYSITIPRLPSHEEIQKQALQHMNAQNEAANQQMKSTFTSQANTTNITFSLPLNSTPTSAASNLMSNSMVTSGNQNCISSASSAITSTSSTTTTTTATVKPRRKPAAKRSAKKTEAAISSAATSNTTTTNCFASSSTTGTTISAPNTTTSSISTPLPTPSLVPSQIGNIQISQIDNRLAGQQGAMVSAQLGSLVENKIQIMPIIDKNNQQPPPQLQQTQLVFQPNLTQNQNMGLSSTTNTGAPTNINFNETAPRQMQLVALPQLSNSSVASNTSMNLNQAPATPGNQSLNTAPPIAAAQQQTSSPAVLPGLTGNVSISVGTPNSIASLIPQLTGSLTLAVSEQCERLILRHDPNQPQDQQSQLILQALLKGALPNVTIINEPTRVDPTKAHQQPPPPPAMQPMGITTQSVNATMPSNPTMLANTVKSNKKSNKQNTMATSNVSTDLPKPIATQQPPINPPNIAKPAETSNPMASSSATLNMNTNVNTNMSVPATLNMQQQRYVALPKIDPATQQLFCLNTLNNQITPIGANQTTASIGPTERLLIAPAGINAQQLAQCLQQGQIHFNDANPLPPQPAPQQAPPVLTNANPQMQQVQPLTNSQQPPKQQIVYPMTSQSNSGGMISTTSTTASTTTTCSTSQPCSTSTTTTTTTKQVANVAPIIDQSKAKQDNKLSGNPSPASTGAVPKKKPVRKPKASTTTAADVALMKNASVVKPLPKLDPLSQKPNNNPVQIVQPNTASGKPVVSTSTTGTTSSTSNVVSIQPFQTQTSTGTKLVGVTAPMQQQPQQNSNLMPTTRPPQVSSSSFTINFSSSTSSSTTTNTPAGGNTTFATSGPNSATLNNGLPLGATNVTPSPAVSQQPQHTVSRVQTIQLTPQQQQMFSQVQMQMQYLTVKMQHKNLLSSMPLPADLDPNVVAAFNKPMTDMEINQALQRLFMEQHRILAAGKEIPTPEQFITNANNVASSTNTTSFNLIPAASAAAPATSVPSNMNESNKSQLSSNIPANVVQPNNHSTMTTANAATAATNNSNMQQQQQQQNQQLSQSTQQTQMAQQTQKIHIYPIQHQQQQQLQQQNKTKTQKTAQQQNQQQSQQQQQQQQQLQRQQPPPPQQQQQLLQQLPQQQNVTINTSKPSSSAAINVATTSAPPLTSKSKQTQPTLLQQQPPNLSTTNLINNSPQLPQLSSLSAASNLPTLPFPSLPQPHMINIANMPAVLQQKHFTQHLQMQQQQLLQNQQKLLNSKVVAGPSFATFQSNNGMLSQGEPPPLIFPSSASTSTATTTLTAATTGLPHLATLTNTQQQFSVSTSSSMPTSFNLTTLAGNQKQFILTSIAPSIVVSSGPATSGGITSISNMQVASCSSTSVINSSSFNTSSATTSTASLSLPNLITTPTPIITSAISSSAAAAATSQAALLTTSGAVTMSPLTTCSLANNVGLPSSILNGGVNIVGNPINQIASVIKTEDKGPSKAKLARLSLFLQQLEVDQQSSMKPDYKNPFQNKEEAVKRLIRYHCMYQNDEDIHSEEEEEFEKTAVRFQEKFRKLSGKFQQILLQESMLQHRTSEICQMEKLMIDDLRQEIEDSKRLEQDILKYEKEPLEELPKELCSEQPQSLFDQIKNEIKTETQDIKQNLDIQSNTDSNSNFCSNLQNTTTSSLDSIKNEIKLESMDNSLVSAAGGKSCSSSMDSFDLLKQSPVETPTKTLNDDLKEPKKEDNVAAWNPNFMDAKSTNNYYSNLTNTTAPVVLPKVTSNIFNGGLKKPSTISSATANCEEKKDNFENFDIESEITPTFIMKKVEHKEATPTSTTTTTTAKPLPVITSTTSNSSTTSTSIICSKKSKVPRLNHVMEKATTAITEMATQQSHQAPAIQQSSSTPQSEVLNNNFDLSQHLQATQATTVNKQQDEDWLCIQKELNLINSNENANNKTAVQNKSLDFLSQESSGDLFPNGCINKNLSQQQETPASAPPPAQTQENQLPTTNCNISTLPSSCSQQIEQPNLSINHDESHHAHLDEFFSGSEDSEVHKTVENRLESMFGESPVHLSGSKDRADTPDDLESIFGESAKSPTSHCVVKEKSNWDSDFAGNSFISNAQQQPSFINSSNSMTHHIQLGSANNPRWMQNMEDQYSDFLNSNNSNVTDCLINRKRQWNGHLVDANPQQQTQPEQQLQEDESPQKKLCGGNLSNTGLNDSSSSSSSPLSAQAVATNQQPQPHHNLVPNDTSHAQDLMDAALLSLHDGLGVEAAVAETNSQTNGYAHMVMTPTNFPNFNHLDAQQQQQQPQQHHAQQQQHFINVNQHQQQQNLTNQMIHHMSHHNHHHPGAGSGEFDDDITRHVQNAIDSILNLQSSEADSLSFSLDHSMGALLGDTILNDNQNANNAAVCHDVVKRRQLVDELGDCLMGGGNSSTDASNLDENHMLMDTASHPDHQHHAQLMNHNNMQHSHGNHHMVSTNNSAPNQQQQQQAQINDFTCIDDAVKSIMTS